MKLRNFSSRASTRGLTLIELVVVLAILIALAGLIIGNFPSMLRRASSATAANTIQDIGRAVGSKFQLESVYGDSYDNLFDNTDLTKITLPTLAAGELLGAGASAIGTSELAALNKAGIVNVIKPIPFVLGTTPDATWAVAAGLSPVVLTDTSVVGTANLTLQAKLIPNNATWGAITKVVIFGVGKNATIVGNSALLEAPTRTGTSVNDAATTHYQRYCVAFVIHTPPGTSTLRATFLGALAPTVDGFQLTEDNQATYQNN